jgi:hypothetical protein
MKTSITNNKKKQEICLQYLGISSRKLAAADGLDEAMKAMNTLQFYIGLARENGCSGREICLALGWSKDRYESLEGPF